MGIADPEYRIEIEPDCMEASIYKGAMRGV